MFRCPEGKCIPQVAVCNYQKDCDKAEDEYQSCRKLFFSCFLLCLTSRLIDRNAPSQLQFLAYKFSARSRTFSVRFFPIAAVNVQPKILQYFFKRFLINLELYLIVNLIKVCSDTLFWSHVVEIFSICSMPRESFYPSGILN